MKSILTILSFCLTCFSLSSQSASISVSTGNVQPDSVVCLEVNIASVSKILGFDFILIWDASVVDLITEDLDGIALLRLQSNMARPIWSRNVLEFNVSFELCFKAVGEIGDFTSIKIIDPNEVYGSETLNLTYLFVTKQSGFVLIGEEDPYYPIAICKEAIEVDVINEPSFSILDLYGGLPADIIDSGSVFKYAMTFENSLSFSPEDSLFDVHDSITFTRHNVCDKSNMELHVWNTNGLRSSCLTRIDRVDPLNRCIPINCREREIIIREDETYILDPTLIVWPSNFRNEEDLFIRIGDDTYAEQYELNMSDVGSYSYWVIDTLLGDSCGGVFTVIESCFIDSCAIFLEVEDKTVKPNTHVSLKLKGRVTDTLASLNIPLKWNSDVLTFTHAHFENNEFRESKNNELTIADGVAGIEYLGAVEPNLILDSFEIALHFEVVGSQGEFTYVDLVDNRFIFNQGSFISDRSLNVSIGRKSGLVVIDETVPIWEIDNSTTIEVYPNPTSNILTISSSDILGESLRVYNTMGQVVQSHSFLTEHLVIDVSNMKAGAYFIVVDGANAGAFVVD